MRVLRYIGSLGFVLGLFVLIFAGVPWRVITSEDPVIPLWLQIAVFSFLGGILLVLATVAWEQRGYKTAVQAASDALESNGGDDVLVLNSTNVPGREVSEVLGVVEGHTVYAIWIGNDLSAIVRLILGGELTEYTEMMGKARAAATARMRTQAARLGAHAIINTRYMTTSVIGSAAELLVYGTAVRLSD